MWKLEKKVVLVTGSARRVGRAIALAFAAEGANLVIHHASASSAEPAQTAVGEARELGVDAIVATGDQSKSEDVTQMLDRVREYYGRLDVLVNSAAIFRRQPFLDIGHQEWEQVMGVNLTGPFMLTQGAARLMVDNGSPGVIINIGDNSGLNGWAAYAHHSVSKAGLIMLTRVAALALAPYHIRVNCVVPGPVLLPPGSDKETAERLAASLPLGRIGAPKNVARACVFLAQDDFATGAILRIDGGEGVAGAGG